jgi:hypothetical protein
VKSYITRLWTSSSSAARISRTCVAEINCFRTTDHTSASSRFRDWQPLFRRRDFGGSAMPLNARRANSFSKVIRRGREEGDRSEEWDEQVGTFA